MVWSWSKFGEAERPESGTSAGESACPVDHTTRQKWIENTRSASSTESKCPVDHKTQATMLAAAKESNTSMTGTNNIALSNEREISSIPRYYMQDSEMPDSAHAPAESTEARVSHWVYPSPSQFYTAVRRKNHNVSANDMDVVVPIHNAVNEEAWRRIVDWERMWNRNHEQPQLVNFVGRPRDVTWRAWFRGLAGYTMPFDRHDWVVVRPHTETQGVPQTMRYIIDFYAGRSESSTDAMRNGAESNKMSFYLDVRPAPSTMEGVAMRIHRWWNGLA